MGDSPWLKIKPPLFDLDSLASAEHLNLNTKKPRRLTGLDAYEDYLTIIIVPLERHT